MELEALNEVAGISVLLFEGVRRVHALVVTIRTADGNPWRLNRITRLPTRISSAVSKCFDTLKRRTSMPQIGPASFSRSILRRRLYFPGFILKLY